MQAKQTITTTFVGIVWILVLTAPVAAQQPAPEGEQKLQQRGGEMQSTNDMMKQCQAHYQEMTTSMDRMMKGWRRRSRLRPAVIT